jgi:hypothetical protein
MRVSGRCCADYKLMLRRRKALTMTETELSDIAALAIMGDKSKPSTGYITPAAIGIPIEL